VVSRAAGAQPQPQSLQEIAEKNEPGPNGVWKLRLYVAGQTPRSIAAFANLKKICEEHVPGRYNIVVDLVKHPQLLRAINPGHSHPGGKLTPTERFVDTL
jgi:hypothetical protein